jgi:homoprotocatechuate degradation regulator HpaR
MRSLDRSLPLKLLKAREAIMDRFRPHLLAHDVTEQQWRVLRALAETDEMDLGSLSRRIALLMPSLSRMVPDLEARGLIKRRRADQDSRIVLVCLTARGRALFDRMKGESEAIYRNIERVAGGELLRRLASDLDTLTVFLDAAQDASAGHGARH